MTDKRFGNPIEGKNAESAPNALAREVARGIKEDRERELEENKDAVRLFILGVAAVASLTAGYHLNAPFFEVVGLLSTMGALGIVVNRPS